MPSGVVFPTSPVQLFLVAHSRQQVTVFLLTVTNSALQQAQFFTYAALPFLYVRLGPDTLGEPMMRCPFSTSVVDRCRTGVQDLPGIAIVPLLRKHASIMPHQPSASLRTLIAPAADNSPGHQMRSEVSIPLARLAGLHQSRRAEPAP